VDPSENLRRLPAIDKVLQTSEVAALKVRFLPRLVDEEVRAAVALARERILGGDEPGDLSAASIAERAAEGIAGRLAAGVTSCVNATGVVLHTGLGRAVIAEQAMEALAREGRGYTVVSVDREEGARIRRETTVARLLCALTGAEAATVVNNNAAATVITLNTLAEGREVILSRGQLVEIGGSFRMPEVFKAAGVTLREVGTTNRTYLRDYAAAISPDTGLLLRVHPSNYRVVGFTHEPSIDELVALGGERGIPVVDDLGAGALVPLPPEPELAVSLRAGVDLVTCSGDKLIGAAQSGIILGNREWVDRVRRNPLFRALRVDKLTLIVLEATLRLFLRPEGAAGDHPTLRMLTLGADDLAKRARALKRRIAKEVHSMGISLRRDFSQVGSGSLPGEDLPTTLVALVHGEQPASAFARALRLADPPVYTRIVDDRVCVDPRTLQKGDDARLVRVLKEIA
jgi:L-seryl-tRNA(Ser) seleniumtransferase